MTSSEDNGLELAWSLRGKLVVGVDPAIVLSSTVDGDIVASGRLRDPSRKVDLKGAGRLSSERVTTPL
ncbi:MAG: hypothetical protein FJ104_11180 [Deltaproteobacteria bacterium]|nr:hypothetical protein [Deltaproteobacteria bacterium]